MKTTRQMARRADRTVVADAAGGRSQGSDDDRRPRINVAESPLTSLAARRGRDGRPLLDDRQVRAGERLRADFTRGAYMRRLGVDWEAGPSGSGGRGPEDLAAAALDARRRVEAAFDAVGPELSGVLLDVCCFLKGLEQVERERDWPVRSGKIVLRTALSMLARHYEPEPPAQRKMIRSWGGDGYRPAMDGTR